MFSALGMEYVQVDYLTHMDKVSIADSTTILDLKHHIASREGISVASQRIYVVRYIGASFRNRKLLDDPDNVKMNIKDADLFECLVPPYIDCISKEYRKLLDEI